MLLFDSYLTDDVCLFTRTQVPCENDRHVTDEIKHEVQHAFQLPSKLNADIDDDMKPTGRLSNANGSDSGSKKKKGFRHSSSRSL